jgi:ferredoxin
VETRTPWATTHRVTIQLPGRSVDITVREDECILAAARAQGLDLPSLCEQGWCITCACWMLAGEVDQSASRRFYAQDREAGFALICTGRPRSDLVLRAGATEALRAHRDRHHLPVPRGTRNPLSQVCDLAHFSPKFHRRTPRLSPRLHRPGGTMRRRKGAAR